MPEMRFVVRWPDDSMTSYYSPSLIVRDYLAAGRSYAVDEFTKAARDALTIASERVRAKYGAPCKRAARELERIEDLARRFPQPGAIVLVERFEDEA